MKRIVQLMILIMSSIPLLSKAQNIAIQYNTVNCSPGGVTITARAPFGDVSGVSWSINYNQLTYCVSGSCTYNSNPLKYTFTNSGVYTVSCTFNGIQYYSNPFSINAGVAKDTSQICGNYAGPPSGVPGSNSTWINSKDLILNCSSGPTIVKGTPLNGSYTPGKLFLKAVNVIILGHGFEAEAGSQFSAEIGDCGTNSTSREAEGLASIENYNTVNEVNSLILPNPNNGSFMLNIDNPEGEDIEVKVRNFVGQEVFNDKFGNALSLQRQMDLTMLEPGVYLTEIRTGNKVGIHKIVISK
jgi:hypothetical protein